LTVASSFVSNPGDDASDRGLSEMVTQSEATLFVLAGGAETTAASLA
jgi:hypothetical protein